MAIGVAISLYTAVLVLLGRVKRIPRLDVYHTGGGQLSAWAVFLLVLTLWSASSIVVQIDTAYTAGVSAVWYGVSVALMSVLVAWLVPWFRARDYISNSALLGRVFGSRVRWVSGAVIGLTFPIFALSNALAAAVYFRLAFHWGLGWSLMVTGAVLAMVIQFGGMLSLVRTQWLNMAWLGLGLGLATWKLWPRGGMVHHVPSAFYHPLGIGHGLVWVWFGMNTLNVFSAQAEIQAVVGAKNIRHGQRAVWASTVVLLVVIGLATWIGMRTRLVVGKPELDGLAAFAMVMLAHGGLWFRVLMALSMWALALSWCGPLLLSGAVSMSQDVWRLPERTRAAKWALLLEVVLMVAYASWRPAEVAWWRVFGLTLRNAAVVGPTLALMVWPELPESVVLSSMVAGVLVGLGANAVTGFSPTVFLWGINPMWLAAATAFGVLGLSRLVLSRRWGCLLGAVLVGGLVTETVMRVPGFTVNRGVLLLVEALLLVAWSWVMTRTSRASGISSIEGQPT